MSEDLTKKLPKSDTDRILTAIANLETYVRTSIDNLVTWISGIDSRLRGLEQKVEQRLYDTRPIWQKVIADISHLQTGQDAIGADLRQVKLRLDRLESNRNQRNSST
jgi:hypothetical protein